MKVFVVHEDPYNAGNPYIYTLMEGIGKLFPDVKFSWGNTLFWSDKIFENDIVHFHWPQTFMASDDIHTPTDLDIRLDLLREKNVKIVATCHDLKAHYNQFQQFSKCLDMVYTKCDAIFHMGNWSLELFSKLYPCAKHLLLPHHLYDSVYTFFPNREESLNHLHLSPKKKYILCLGMFRAKEEQHLVKKLSSLLVNENVNILAPAFMNVKQNFRCKIIPTKDYILKKYYRVIYHISCSGKTWVPVSDENIPYYYGASNIAFIHRLKILNSGNAVLPLLFGKVAVGPNIGNCGEFLIDNFCPTFNVPNADNLKDAVMEGFKLSEDVCFTNQLRTSALKKYSTEKISSQLYEYYRQLV